MEEVRVQQMVKLSMFWDAEKHVFHAGVSPNNFFVYLFAAKITA
ncbi:MAG: hypothetical protein ACK4GQ_04985 [Candidatus Hadarchaeales archaeon]